jgi:hypothetical protein
MKMPKTYKEKKKNSGVQEEVESSPSLPFLSLSYRDYMIDSTVAHAEYNRVHILPMPVSSVSIYVANI